MQFNVYYPDFLAVIAILLIISAILGKIPIWNKSLNKKRKATFIGLAILLLIWFAFAKIAQSKPDVEPEEIPATVTFTPADTDSIPTEAAHAIYYFYQIIMNAANKDDLKEAWLIMSPEFRAISSDTLEDFQDRWWEISVIFEIFSCENDDVVDAHLIYTNRDDGTKTGRELTIRYTLEEKEPGNWQIVDGIKIDGTNCELFSIN